MCSHLKLVKTCNHMHVKNTKIYMDRSWNCFNLFYVQKWKKKSLKLRAEVWLERTKIVCGEVTLQTHCNSSNVKPDFYMICVCVAAWVPYLSDGYFSSAMQLKLQERIVGTEK